MPRQEQVVSISQSSNSVNGDYDKLEFIRCVGVRQPDIHEVWTLGDDRITHKVYPFALVDVRNFVGGFFATITLLKMDVGCPCLEGKSIK